MADSLTPNLGLTKPEVGASSDAWGDNLNGNMDKIDAALGPGAITPAQLTEGAPTWDEDGALTAGGAMAAAALIALGTTFLKGNGSDFQIRHVGTLISIDFSLVSHHALTYDLSNGKLTLFTNNIPVFSVDISGNVVAKGTITQNGSP